MKAWILPEYGGVEKLQLADMPEPAPGPGEVVLAVRYAAINPADRYLTEKLYPANPTFPHILGREAVGAVVATGAGTQHIARDKRYVLIRGEAGVNRPGTLAARVAVPAENLAEVPDEWTDEESAGAVVGYLTAYQALTQWGELPQAVVLITGASGGVGVASIQLATAMGHTVVALSRSAEKRGRLRQLGAAHAFDPTDPRWRDACKNALDPRRVDLAIDNIGGPLLPQVIDTLGMHAKVSIVGRLAGPVPQFNTASLFFRRIRLGGVAIGACTIDESRTAWSAILQLLRRTNARPLVDQVFGFQDLKPAFARLEAGPMGKVIVRVTDRHGQ